MKFTYASYQQLLHDIVEAGYTMTNYHTCGSLEMPCILRHDVDFDLDKALTLAQIEADAARRMGIKIASTFFILINTNFYNAFTSMNRKKLAKILELGHEIGLHFVETPSEADEDSLKVEILNEIEILSRIIARKVRTVSIHRPSARILKANLIIPGVVNAYSRTFVGDYKYLTDSRMHWREDVEAIVKSGQHKRLHIVAHPFWYEDIEQTIESKLSSFVRNANAQRYQWLKGNIRDFETILREVDV